MNDYIYDMEAEQFSFLRVPKVLIRHEAYKGISVEAKLLYSIFLDRVGISLRNGWIDENRRVFIIFTIDEIQEQMNCGNKKAVQLLGELETKAGLIERKRQGLGRPNLIYVKSFIRTIDENGERHFLKCQNDISGNVKTTLPEVSESHSNNTDINKTEKNKTENSFLPEAKGTKYEEYKSYFQNRLGYESLLHNNPMDQNILEGILELLAEICSSRKRTIRVAGEDMPAEIVKKRLLNLQSPHISYVLDSMNDNTTNIRDMKQYLLTTLFNAPVTIDLYYQSKVKNDLYGVC